MSHRFVRALAVLVLMTVLGCEGGQEPAATGGRDAGGSPTGGPAAESIPDEKALAELDQQIEAMEKKLAAFRAKADALRAKFAAKKPAADAIPVAKRLDQVPKDLWPKDFKDSLRIEQVKE
jgi:hypothetical protein